MAANAVSAIAPAPRQSLFVRFIDLTPLKSVVVEFAGANPHGLLDVDEVSRERGRQGDVQARKQLRDVGSIAAMRALRAGLT